MVISWNNCHLTELLRLPTRLLRQIAVVVATICLPAVERKGAAGPFAAELAQQPDGGAARNFENPLEGAAIDGWRGQGAELGEGLRDRRSPVDGTRHIEKDRKRAGREGRGFGTVVPRGEIAARDKGGYRGLCLR
jgi:hypothetical protein